MSTPHPHDPAQTPRPSHERLLPMLLTPAFVTLPVVSSVNVILSAVSHSLSADTAGLQFVVSGYALVFGVVLVPVGRAGDVMGWGQLFVIGMLLFGTGSPAPRPTSGVATLNLAHVVMGVGSGLLNPQATGMIQQYYSGEARGRVFVLSGAVIGVSVALGPVLSDGFIGWLGDDWGWHAFFLVNVLLALAGVWAARRYLPVSARRRESDMGQMEQADSPDGDAAGAAHCGGVDPGPVGMGLLTIGTLLIMIPFMEAFVGAWIWGLEAVGIGVTGVWVAQEKRYRARGGTPMVDLSLLIIPSSAYGSLVIAVYFLGYISAWIIVAQCVQAGLGSTALTSGLIGVPAALARSVTVVVADRRVIRAGRIMVLGGMVLGIAGLLASVGIMHMHMRTGWSPWWLTLMLLVLGVGQGFVVFSNQALSPTNVPLEYVGVAGGILQAGECIGTSTGITVTMGLTSHVPHSPSWEAAAQADLLVAMATIVVATGVAIIDLRLTRRRRRQPGGPRPGTARRRVSHAGGALVEP